MIIQHRGYIVKAMPRPKSKKKRIETITSILEVIVSHCLKINSMQDSDSVPHWKQEVATHILQLGKVKMPSGRYIDTETMEQYIEQQTTYKEVYTELELLSAEYGKELYVVEGIDTIIRDLIKDEYQSVVFSNLWTIKDVYKSKYLKQICEL